MITLAVTAAYAATVQATARVIVALNEQVKELEVQVHAHFGAHPDAEIYLSQPGIGTVTGARVLGEFGDAPGRYASAKGRKNYAGSSPITRASGRSKIVLARFVRSSRLADALHSRALSALTASPGARACHDQQRARGQGRNAALRQVSNRLVGIQHGCLKTSTRYDEATAWPNDVAHTGPLAA